MKRKITKRKRRKIGIRKKISGTIERPRLSVYRSLNHIYAQLVDDSSGRILTSASTLSNEVADEVKNAKGKVAKGKIVGSLIAKKASEIKISTILFDRTGYKYHGRVKAVDEAAREGGLKF